jgi:hypothetical protein
MNKLGYITEEHAKAVCKPGTTECCRYLTMGPRGWSCEKHSTLSLAIDKRVAEGTMRAIGDNCEGRLPR